MLFSEKYFRETQSILEQMNHGSIETLAQALLGVRNEQGRLFFLGVGGSAGHASHAVNDFRKIAGFEAYCLTDNVSELTARINDESWESCFRELLKGSRLKPRDAIFVLSVGGGSQAKKISVNLVEAVDYAVSVGAKVFGILGKDGGFTAQRATACVVIPPLMPERVTPHTEGLCAVVWHLLVSHPLLQLHPTTWESQQREHEGSASGGIHHSEEEARPGVMV